jgi:hypothetical protein
MLFFKNLSYPKLFSSFATGCTNPTRKTTCADDKGLGFDDKDAQPTTIFAKDWVTALAT